MSTSTILHGAISELTSSTAVKFSSESSVICSQERKLNHVEQAAVCSGLKKELKPWNSCNLSLSNTKNVTHNNNKMLST
jgi:hypothetical protein